MLPGAFCLPAAPLPWFSREAMQAHGWSVLQVWDQRDSGRDPQKWVDDRLEAALEFIENDPRVVVLAKSLTSMAAPAVAEAGLPAIRLTPLLQSPEAQRGLSDTKAPALAIGGTADPLWDSGVAARSRNAEVVEILGADHGIQIPGDPAGSVEALAAVVAATDRFIGGLAG